MRVKSRFAILAPRSFGHPQVPIGDFRCERQVPIRLVFCTFRRAEEMSSGTACVLVVFGY